MGKTLDWEKYESGWKQYLHHAKSLYHWTHLIEACLWEMSCLTGFRKKDLAIFAEARTPEFSNCGLMKKFNVEVVRTTDDPVDTLGIILH